jgi:prepilin-type N-terminal cleavage/methylation domain-containing protein
MTTQRGQHGFTRHHFSASRKNSAGFTLIEMLVYLALFALIMTGAFVSAYQLIEHSARTQAQVERSEELGFLIRKITWALGSAVSVGVSGDDTLTIVTGAGTLRFEHDGEALLLNGEPLSSNRVSVSGWSVSYEPGSGRVAVGVTIDETDTVSTTVYVP